MKLSELKKALKTVITLNFELPGGAMVPPHFHVTEVGRVTKHFIDCGGKERTEELVNFQLWEAGDVDHRLAPQKLSDIISLSEKVLAIDDGEIEVEYQGETIGKYGLEYNGKNFVLTVKNTACLASDACGIPLEKQKVKLVELNAGGDKTSCIPGGGCC